MQEIQELLNTVKHENGNFNAVARCVLERPALETTSTELIVQELQQAITELGDGDATVVGVPYWTDGAILVHSASIPTCLFGPGDINVAHSPDEYVRMEDVLRASEVYIGVARKFCA
jgi:acetylornithine deacetylase